MAKLKASKAGTGADLAWYECTYTKRIEKDGWDIDSLQEPDQLVGATIAFNWQHPHGWYVGRVVRHVSSRWYTIECGGEHNVVLDTCLYGDEAPYDFPGAWHTLKRVAPPNAELQPTKGSTKRKQSHCGPIPAKTKVTAGKRQKQVGKKRGEPIIQESAQGLTCVRPQAAAPLAAKRAVAARHLRTPLVMQIAPPPIVTGYMQPATTPQDSDAPARNDAVLQTTRRVLAAATQTTVRGRPRVLASKAATTDWCIPRAAAVQQGPADTNKEDPREGLPNTSTQPTRARPTPPPGFMIAPGYENRRVVRFIRI